MFIAVNFLLYYVIGFLLLMWLFLREYDLKVSDLINLMAISFIWPIILALYVHEKTKNNDSVLIKCWGNKEE